MINSDLENLILQLESNVDESEYPLVGTIPIRDFVCSIVPNDSCCTISMLGSDPIKLEDHHDQDCCESVYADWDYTKLFIEQDFSPKYYESLHVYGVPEGGILLRFFAESNTLSFFVPCYNVQNGYYGSNLDLRVGDSVYHISDYVKDDIH